MTNYFHYMNWNGVNYENSDYRYYQNDGKNVSDGSYVTCGQQ